MFEHKSYSAAISENCSEPGVAGLHVGPIFRLPFAGYKWSAVIGPDKSARRQGFRRHVPVDRLPDPGAFEQDLWTYVQRSAQTLAR